MTLAGDVEALVGQWQDEDRWTHPGLLWQVRAHLDPVRFADSPGVKSVIVAGNAPWSEDTSDLWTEVHAGARQLEVELLWAVANVARKRRPGSDGHTRAALLALPRLATAAPAALRQQVELTVRQWRRSAEVLLGVERRWAFVRTVGTNEDGRRVTVTHCCPHCGTPLRVQPDLAYEGDPDRHLPERRLVLVEPSDAVVICPNDGCYHPITGTRWVWPINRFTGLVLESA